MTLTADALQRLLEDENPLSASQRALLSSPPRS